MEEKCEREEMCVSAARFKEGQWRGSGIIWRGRCWNILSWITTLYTGEMDGRTTDRQAGGEEEEEERDRRKTETDERRQSRKSTELLRKKKKTYLEERKSLAKHFFPSM